MPAPTPKFSERFNKFQPKFNSRSSFIQEQQETLEVVKKCSEHGHASELICLKCKTKVCPRCALFGSHKGHDVKEMSEV